MTLSVVPAWHKVLEVLAMLFNDLKEVLSLLAHLVFCIGIEVTNQSDTTLGTTIVHACYLADN